MSPPPSTPGEAFEVFQVVIEAVVATQADDFTDAEKAILAQIYAAELGVHENAVDITTAEAAGGGYTITATISLPTQAEADAAKSTLEEALSTADAATTFLSQDDTLDVAVSSVLVGDVSSAIVVSDDACADLGQQCGGGGGGSGGAVAGGVIGGLLFVGLVAGAIMYYRKQQGSESTLVPLSHPAAEKPKLEGTSKI